MSLRSQFDGLDERVWLNCAHQGPLPRPAVAAVRDALDRKRSPWRIDDESFEEVPRRLKSVLGQLVGAPAEDVILGNSTSYGLDVLARGLPLGAGDEVLLVAGDFPATVYPWLPLRERGVVVRLVDPGPDGLTAEMVDASITRATRILCCSWVFSFTGRAIPLEAVAEVCRGRGVTFVLNGSQAVGARPLDLATSGVDALVACGFKWLCGPYATGFAWIRPEIRETMATPPAYWLTHQSAGNVARTVDYGLQPVGASAYDVFGTANFLNFPAWTASLELLVGHGVDRIAAYDQRLVQRLIDGLDESDYELLSPREPPERSTLVYVRHRRVPTDEVQARLSAAGVEAATREGNLRLSPHVYNEPAEIDRALNALTIGV
jgi:cysteine desulfurase / selenocysteine lyase